MTSSIVQIVLGQDGPLGLRGSVVAPPAETAEKAIDEGSARLATAEDCRIAGVPHLASPAASSPPPQSRQVAPRERSEDASVPLAAQSRS